MRRFFCGLKSCLEWVVRYDIDMFVVNDEFDISKCRSDKARHPACNRAEVF